ncbi:MAG: ATP-binding protein [Peptoniphilus sp.]|nr:ATP-binding protein [Peptoniphilus sp.]MDD7363707.1 ATP-binding protein [Bacillota bacterium]MDY6044092.1 ATP-binding protein [Peptoniphilus sp.]
MNKKTRRFSIIIACFIAFIFQIFVSLELNNRGIRLKEQEILSIANALDHLEGADERGAWLKTHIAQSEDTAFVYVDDRGEILYSDALSSEAQKILRAANTSVRDGKSSKGWILFQKGMLENKYMHWSVYGDGTRMIAAMTHDSMLASTLHYLPYTALTAIIGSLVLYGLLVDRMERYRKDMKYLLYNFKKYVRDPQFRLNLPSDLGEYEDIIVDASTRIRTKIDRLNSQLTGLEDMVENMTEGVVFVGRDRKILSINDAAVKLFNASIYMSYVGKDLMYLCRESDFYAAFSRAFLAKKDEIHKIELEGLIIKFFFDPVFNEEGEFYGMLILMIDETQQTLAERSRREFTSNVTHELKTPLTSISGYAELLRTGMVKEEDENKFLDIIIEESQNLFDLIDAIIAMSRSEEKNRPEAYRSVDMKALIKDIMTTLQPDCDMKHLHVRVQANGDNRLWTHPELMKEVLSNLIDNAIAYNVERGDISIVLDGSDEDEFIVTIQDTGIGISYDDQKRIFERFYMVDKSRSYNQKSTGLGLAIVKHNVESLKGTIDVKSQIHKGTVFTLRFPKTTNVSTQ